MTSLLASAALLMVPRSAQAQPIDSTTALKEACEAGDHFIYVTTDIKINSGPHEDVASGCSIVLGPAASFEADQVSMSFAGPFGIGTSRERSVTFTESVWEAPSLGFSGSDKSSFRSIASRLRATAGDIGISTGREGSVQLQYRPSGSLNGLEAAGSVYITEGKKLSLSLSDTGIEGGTGVWIQLWGHDSALKAEHAELRGGSGPVIVATSHLKVLVELKSVTLASAGGDTTVSLAGTESVLKAAFASISSSGGNVDLSAGTNGWVGTVELDETSVAAMNGVTIQGSPGGRRYGTVKSSKSTFSAGSDIVFGTGAFGTTEVKDSGISSGTAIHILTGTGGSCQASSNQYEAPVLEICP